MTRYDPPMPDPMKLDEVSISEPNPQDICSKSETLAEQEFLWEGEDPEMDKDAEISEEYAEAMREPVAVGANCVEPDPFTFILNELELLHNKKRADYGSSSDPYANVRASSEFGIPPWIGVMVRANDKVKRIKAAATGSTMQNESIIDSFNDLAVYAIIARILYESHESLEKAIKDGYVSEAQVT